MLLEPLLANAAGQTQTVAVVDDSGSYSYGQLARMALGAGGVIASQTQRPGVGLLLPSGVGFVASFFGALSAKRFLVPINFLLGDREVAHCVADSGIDTVITLPQLAGRVKELGLKVLDVTQLGAMAAGLSGGQTAPSRDAGADDLAVLMYTSGTSGLPKGVPLTYGNLQSNVDSSIAHVAFQSQHKFLGIVPLFHAFGLTAMLLAPIQLGATIVYMARFSPVGAVNAIKMHGISIMGGVPSMFGAMLRLKDASADDFKSIYAMISGGEPLPSTVREAFAARFGVTLYEAYGMTETSLAIAVNTPQMHKAGSVGKAIPGMRIKVIDDGGSAVPAGNEGEICVTGPMVMKGYHKLPNETAAAMTADGYFRTGDLGRIDEDGFLFITGRKKDLIIVAGEKASPREIEEMLMSHPAVAEAAVIGVKDASRGEVIAAFVIAREGATIDPDELRAFCRQQGLAQWKIPRQVHVVRDLPRSATGKVLKRELRPPSGGETPT